MPLFDCGAQSLIWKLLWLIETSLKTTLFDAGHNPTLPLRGTQALLRRVAATMCSCCFLLSSGAVPGRCACLASPALPCCTILLQCAVVVCCALLLHLPHCTVQQPLTRGVCLCQCRPQARAGSGAARSQSEAQIRKVMNAMLKEV